jgi:hypothetical protein
MPDFPHYFRAVWMSPSANACTLRDSADADGATLDKQAARGHEMRTKVPPVRNANGYSKDRSRIDVAADTVTCPAHQTVSIRAGLRTASRASVRSASRVRCGRTAPKPVRGGRSVFTRVAARQSASMRCVLATGLPNVSASGGTQDQPLHPPPRGRPKSPLPRTQTRLYEATQSLSRVSHPVLTRGAAVPARTAGWRRWRPAGRIECRPSSRCRRVRSGSPPECRSSHRRGSERRARPDQC